MKLGYVNFATRAWNGLKRVRKGIHEASLTMQKLRVYDSLAAAHRQHWVRSQFRSGKKPQFQPRGFFHAHSASSFGRAVWGAARLADAPIGLRTRTVPPSPFRSVVGGSLTKLGALP